MTAFAKGTTIERNEDSGGAEGSLKLSEVEGRWEVKGAEARALDPSLPQSARLPVFFNHKYCICIARPQCHTRGVGGLKRLNGRH
jgi:hypothetical protein